MTQPVQKLDFEFPFSDISRKSLEHIGDTIRIVQFLHESSIQLSEYRETPLPTDELPFIIGGIKSETYKLPELKSLALKWLNEKALEEFVVGIFLCLEEANKFLLLQKTAEESAVNPIASEEAAEEIKKQIDKKVKETNFPGHLEQIEKYLNIQLPFKEDILSINSLRNCLVHRNGVVHEKDFNDKAAQCLKLRWVELSHTLQLVDGEWKKLNFELRENGVEAKNIQIQFVEKELCFLRNSVVTLDINTLNGVGWTCIFFINSLYEALHQSITDRSRIRFI